MSDSTVTMSPPLSKAFARAAKRALQESATIYVVLKNDRPYAQRYMSANPLDCIAAFYPTGEWEYAFQDMGDAVKIV